MFLSLALMTCHEFFFSSHDRPYTKNLYNILDLLVLCYILLYNRIFEIVMSVMSVMSYILLATRKYIYK